MVFEFWKSEHSFMSYCRQRLAKHGVEKICKCTWKSLKSQIKVCLDTFIWHQISLTVDFWHVKLNSIISFLIKPVNTTLIMPSGVSETPQLINKYRKYQIIYYFYTFKCHQEWYTMVLRYAELIYSNYFMIQLVHITLNLPWGVSETPKLP